MIGTDKQYMPFYPEKRPVVADLIVDNDIDGLEKFYGKKKGAEVRDCRGSLRSK